MTSTPNQLTTVEKEYLYRWIKGIPYEVAFWKSYYRNKKRRADLFKWSNFGKVCELDDFDVQGFISSQPEESPVILDLGCALSYMFGNIFPSKPDVRIDYVDPLASFYNKILYRFKIERPNICFGMIENISSSYPKGRVSLIHVRNALDHCANPLRGIIESLACLRLGGVLYLNHFRNEALNEDYRGFHQWNLESENGAFILWNNNERINVAETLKDCATVTTTITSQNRLVVVICKNKELSDDLYMPEISAVRSSNMISDIVEYFNSFPNVARYQFLRVYCTIGHTIMRNIPYYLLNKIKKTFSRNK